MSVVPLHSPRVVSLFRATSVPVTMVVNHDGRVLYAHRGVFEAGAVEDSVRVALRWKPRAPSGPFPKP